MSELISLGVQSYARGALEESERLWRAALEIDPGNVRARVYLSQVCPPAAVPEPPPPAPEPAPTFPSALPEAGAAEMPPVEVAATAPGPEAPPPPEQQRTGATRTGRFTVRDDVRTANRPRPAHRARRWLLAAGVLALVAGGAAWGLQASSRGTGARLAGTVRGGAAAAWSAIAGVTRDLTQGASALLSRAIPGESSGGGQAGSADGTASPGPPSSPRPATRSVAGGRAAAPSSSLTGFDGDPGRLVPGARWGTTLEEALSRWPTSSRVEEGDRSAPPGLVTRLRIDPVVLEGRRWDAFLLFDEGGRLAGIRLQTGVAGSAQPAFGAMATSLRTEVGTPSPEPAPSPVDHGGWRAGLHWATGNALVDLQGQDASPENARVLSVDVRRGGLEPRSDGQVVLLLVDPRIAGTAGDAR